MYKLQCAHSTCHSIGAWSAQLAKHRHGLLSQPNRLFALCRTSRSLSNPCSASLSFHNDDATEDSGPDTSQHKGQRAARPLISFFSSSQQQFARQSRLPPSFYADVESVRSRLDLSETPPPIAPADSWSVEQTPDIATHPFPSNEFTLAHESGFRSLQDNHPLLDDALLESPPRKAFLDKTWDTTGTTNPRKKDLSLARATRHDSSLSHRPSFVDHAGQSHGFQHWSDHRSLTDYFIRHLYRHWSSGQHLPIAATLHLLRQCENRGSQHIVDDIVAWSWVLAADGSLSIRRFVALSEHNRDHGLKPVPLWVLLQLLRANYIDNPHLRLLVTECCKNISRLSHNKDAQSILIVRLLRHSRKAAAVCLKDIVELAIQIMSNMTNTTRQRKFMTMWCNRLLSLLALPSSPRALASMRSHQTSQLNIVRFMQESDAGLHITREGYRALLRTQLMHPKTTEEQKWARAKSAAWPPWQPINPMGLQVKTDFPGRTTRLMKVLQRMNDNGYSSHEFDVASKVLSGWDTDRSPTIQVRRPASFLPLPRPWRAGKVVKDLSSLHQVWLARVESTRTVREAWMCFCSYTGLVSSGNRSVQVYHAMLRKLLARVYKPSRTHNVLPGDGLEVYTDPVDTRDLVWISEPIPEVKTFVQQLSDDGHRLSTNMLADLLDSAHSPDEVEAYIRSSDLDEDVQNLLTQDNVYLDLESAYTIADLPKRLFISYIKFLTRPQNVFHKLEPVGPHTSQNLSDSIPPNVLTSPSAHFRAWNILRLSRPQQPVVWDTYLRALESHIYTPHGQKVIGLSRIWDLTMECLREMRGDQTPEITRTFNTFSPIAAVALQVSLQEYLTGKGSNMQHSHKQPWRVAMLVFAEAVTGRSSACFRWSELMERSGTDALASIPTGHDIESMAWLIWLHNHTSQTKSLLDLLSWLGRHQSQFFAAGNNMSKKNMSAFRVMLEGHWADDEEWDKGSVHVANDTQLEKFTELCEIFGYPDDSEVITYLGARKWFVERVRSKMKSKEAHLNELQK